MTIFKKLDNNDFTKLTYYGGKAYGHSGNDFPILFVRFLPAFCICQKNIYILSAKLFFPSLLIQKSHCHSETHFITTVLS